jgi:hypothetical protein
MHSQKTQSESGKNSADAQIRVDFRRLNLPGILLGMQMRFG